MTTHATFAVFAVFLREAPEDMLRSLAVVWPGAWPAAHADHEALFRHPTGWFFPLDPAGNSYLSYADEQEYDAVREVEAVILSSDSSGSV